MWLFNSAVTLLCRANLSSFRTFQSLANLKFNLLTFAQCTKTIHLDLRMMNKNVFSTIVVIFSEWVLDSE